MGLVSMLYLLLTLSSTHLSSASSVISQVDNTAFEVIRNLCIHDNTLPLCKRVPLYADRLISKKANVIPLRGETEINQKILDIRRENFFDEIPTEDELNMPPHSLWDWMNTDPSYLATALMDPQDLLSSSSYGTNKHLTYEIRKHRHKREKTGSTDDSDIDARHNWGFESTEVSSSDLTNWPSKPPQAEQVKTPAMLPPNPNNNGLFKDIGSIDVGFGVGVGVPGNDPVSVGTKVGVGFGESGLAGKLPIGENIYPRQGEHQSLNDYDGNKYDIVPGKAGKYIQAIREGRIIMPQYAPIKSLIGINSGVGVGGK